MINRSKALGIIFGILFCFDRLPIPIGPLVMPPIYVFTMFYCIVGIFVGLKLNSRLVRVLSFIFALFLHSTIFVSIFGIDSTPWLLEYFEFVVKLVLVSSMMICLSNIYAKDNSLVFFKGICLGLLLTISLATLHVIWMLTGAPMVGDLVSIIRNSLVLPGFASGIDQNRIASFSNEPSSYGALIFLFALPIVFIVTKTHLYSAYVVFLGFLSVSSTAILSFLTAAIFSKSVVVRLILFLVICYLFYTKFDIIIDKFEDNYMIHSISIIFENIRYALQVDARLGSSLFLFFEKPNISMLIGSGVGAINIIGEQRLTPELWANLKIVSQGNPNLKTLIGNYLFDFGLLFTLPIIAAFIFYFKSVNEINMLQKYLIIALISYSFFGFSYISPILWFWVATFSLIQIAEIKEI